MVAESGHAAAGTLRIGVLTEQPQFAAWEARAIRGLLAVDGVELALVMRASSAPRGAWSTLERAWFNPRSRAMRSTELDAEVAGVTHLACHLSRGADGALSLSQTELEAVRFHHLDVIVSFARGRAGAELAAAAAGGVWSFERWAEEARGEDGPLGFWEVAGGRTLTEAALVRTGADGRTVLRSGAFRTFPWSFVSSRDQVLQAIERWPAQACRELLAGGDTGQQLAVGGGRYREPNAAQLAWLVSRQFVAFVRKAVLSVSRRDHWIIGLIDRPLSTVALSGDLSGTRWMDELAEPRLIADPHGLQDEDVATILVEDVDPRTNKGRIAAIEHRPSTGFSEPRVVMDFPTHASYPLLVEADDSVYCIPETSAQRRVVLLQTRSFPDDWVEVATLIDDRALADATVLFHDGRWWMWALDIEVGDNCALVLWYADSLTGPWTPHPLNPVKLDVRSARPAGGLFFDDGHLYRPAQDCSVTYGGRIVLTEVTELSTDRYAERTVSTIDPDPTSPYPLGVHTISSIGEMTVIDGKRLSKNGVADIAAAARKGLRRIRSLA